MILKTTGLSARFQRKNRIWKICTGSQDINQNLPTSGSPNQTCIFWHLFANISGPGAYFSKPIFALKPWVQAGYFEYYEPYNPKNFFSDFPPIALEFIRISSHTPKNILEGIAEIICEDIDILSHPKAT